MHSDDWQDDEGPSKSQLKREMLELQELGRQLAEADAELLAKCELPERLLEELDEYRRLKSHEARRRQMQFIGKLMRDVDTDRIRTVLEQRRRNATRQARRLHLVEQWRDALVAGQEGALDRLIAQYPELDIQHLRQLVRQAQKEARENKAPSASRKLFRYLRELDSLE